MSEEKLRICKKCLIRELADQAETYQTIKEYIDNLDVDIKADEQLVEERLNICKECEMLLAGMCRSCGCYVEMRTAIHKNNCPRKKW